MYNQTMQFTSDSYRKWAAQNPKRPWDGLFRCLVWAAHNPLIVFGGLGLFIGDEIVARGFFDSPELTLEGVVYNAWNHLPQGTRFVPSHDPITAGTELQVQSAIHGLDFNSVHMDDQTMREMIHANGFNEKVGENQFIYFKLDHHIGNNGIEVIDGVPHVVGHGTHPGRGPTIDMTNGGTGSWRYQ